MITMLMTTTLSLVLSGSRPEYDYTLAYRQSIQEDKPLMVVVGADWCPACTQLKNSTIRSMERSGDLKDVRLAVVDRDRDPELAQRLMKGETRIPQIIVFSKDSTGRWQSGKLTGFQSAQPVRSLIRRVLTVGRG